jgi:hypothetical protein
MATDSIMSGLFGITPEGYQAQQNQQALAQSAQLAQLDPFASARTSLIYGGRQLGSAIGGALGAQDPMLQKISAQNQILQGLDITNPQSIASGIERAQQAGIPELAFKLLAVRDDAMKRQAVLQSQQRMQQAQGLLPSILVQGTPEQVTPEKVIVDEAADTSYLQPATKKEATPTMINQRVVEQLSVTPEGQAVLEGFYKAQKSGSEADKAQAEANIKIVEARYAPESQKAKLIKESADAQKAAIDANWEDKVKAIGYAKTVAEIKNINSEIGVRGAKLGLDTQTTQVAILEKLAQINKLNTDIPESTRKIINDSAVVAATSKQAANQFNDLASRIESAGGGYGGLSTFNSYLTKVGGFQNGTYDLRQEYTRLRNNSAIKSLPPGPATDKDISLALSGFPTETADARTLASFLRGMAKLQEIDAAVANAKTDWVTQNNGVLTRANKTFVAGDYTAKQGETFVDFSNRIAKDVNSRYSGVGERERVQSLVSQIPTTGERPSTGTNILNQADQILARPRGGR